MIMSPCISIVESNIIKIEEKSFYSIIFHQLGKQEIKKNEQKDSITPTFFKLFLLNQIKRLLLIFKIWIIWKIIKIFFKKQPNESWWNSDWKYRKKITIDHTKVEGTLNNFTVLVSYYSSNFADKAQEDGDDFTFILFENDEHLQLYHEIEYYNSSNGKLISWVNFPLLSDNKDTEFYIYYGNSNCDNQQLPGLVWDSNYQAVWHFCEIGTDKRQDSTNYNRHATPYNYDCDEGIVQGKINGADDFDGIDDYLRTDVSFDYDYRTVSFWIKTDVKPSDPNIILSQNANTLKYGLIYANIQSDGFHAKAAGEAAGQEFIFDIDFNTWYMMQLIRDHDTTKYYVNGNLIDTGVSGTLGAIWYPNPNLIIGSSRFYDRLFEGIIDEVRISNIVRRSEWILTEYNNQNDSTSFLSFGPEEKSIIDTNFADFYSIA